MDNLKPVYKTSEYVELSTIVSTIINNLDSMRSALCIITPTQKITSRLRLHLIQVQAPNQTSSHETIVQIISSKTFSGSRLKLQTLFKNLKFYPIIYFFKFNH
jgi:hypothetical protein